MPNEIGLTRDRFIDTVIDTLGVLYPGEQGDAILSIDDLADIATAFTKVHNKAAEQLEVAERHADPRRV